MLALGTTLSKVFFENEVTNDGLIFVFQLVNTGRSPAVNASLYIHGLAAGYGTDCPTFEYVETPHTRSAAVGVGQLLTSAPVGMNDTNTALFIANECEFYAYIRAEYSDIFTPDIQHLTEMCLRLRCNGMQPDERGVLRPRIETMPSGEQNRIT